MINKYQISNIKYQNRRGISLIEILVVVSIFSILGILITRSIILTVSGSKRSESTIKVRESLNYSMSVMERQLRNANSIAETSCPNTDKTYLAYVDQNGNPTTFSCITSAGFGVIASGSANLTSSDINVINCSIDCTPGTGLNPPVITISVTARDAGAANNQNSNVTLTSQINLRNY